MPSPSSPWRDRRNHQTSNGQSYSLGFRPAWRRASDQRPSAAESSAVCSCSRIRGGQEPAGQRVSHQEPQARRDISGLRQPTRPTSPPPICGRYRTTSATASPSGADSSTLEQLSDVLKTLVQARLLVEEEQGRQLSYEIAHPLFLPGCGLPADRWGPPPGAASAHRAFAVSCQSSGPKPVPGWASSPTWSTGCSKPARPSGRAGKAMASRASPPANASSTTPWSATCTSTTTAWPLRPPRTTPRHLHPGPNDRHPHPPGPPPRPVSDTAAAVACSA